MKKWLLMIVFGAVLVLAACGGSSDDDKDESKDGSGESVETSQAEDLYKESCASCHATDLSGQAGPALADVGSRLTEDEIETVINEGKGIMKGGLVNPNEAKELASWLAEKK